MLTKNGLTENGEQNFARFKNTNHLCCVKNSEISKSNF